MNRAGDVLMNRTRSAFMNRTRRTGNENEPLIREVMTFIELHQERWRQNAFLALGECGTVGCFMGWAAVLTQESVDLAVLDEKISGDYLEPVVTAAFHDPDRLMERLGLTPYQFYSIYDWTTVSEPADARYTTLYHRQPTFQELCDRVEDLTGVRFKPAPRVLDEGA